ncbi:MAG: tetratricopeptide repeat protein [Leptolyngbya sp. SIO4C1]|nr:tetratricopeptide repeat protein [Leptolyngbya sp. SIO4C1]
MKILFKIGLVLLIGLCNLSAVSASRAAPAPTAAQQAVDQENIAQDESLKSVCFSKADLEGLESCKKLVFQDRSDSRVWNQLGRIYYALESYGEAYLSFKYATALRTDYAIAWANACAALNQLQDYERALSACDKSLELVSASETSDDERIVAWNNKAIVLYFLGRYQESLDALDNTLSIKPDNLEAKLNRILVLHALAHEKPSKDNNFVL